MATTQAGPHTAFFYGTLMAPKVLHRVCHGANVPLPTTGHNTLIIKPALLQKHRRHRVKHADYPAVLPDPEGTVRGTLVTGLTDGDIWRLDIFEGSEYERRKVKVRELKYEGDISEEPTRDQLGKEVEAETYIWIGPEGDLEMQEWDFKEFVETKMWAWTGDMGEARSDYKDVDDAVKASSNDPTRGRGANGALTKSLEESREKKEAEVMESAV